MSAPWGREGASNNVDKSGMVDGAVSGHPFSVVSVREKRAFQGHSIIMPLR